MVPDLTLLVIVSWGLLHGAKEGLLWAFGGGLLLDLLSGGPFGALTVSCALASVATGLGALSLIRESLWLPFSVGVLATAAYDLAYVVILQVTGRPFPGWSGLLQVMVPGIIVNGLVMYPTYWAMRWYSQRAG